MKDWQKHAGQIALLLLSGAFFLVWRLGLLSFGGGETAVLFPQTARDDPTGPTETIIELSDQATPFPTAVSQFAPGSIPILQDNSLSPLPNPVTYQGNQPQHDFQTYIVERGDTPNKIADRFGISAETLLGGNPSLSEESSLLQVDAELIILPIDGVLHTVVPGDTLEEISARYGISVDSIVAYAPNQLEFPYRLYPETQILVPGAVREVFVWTPPTLETVRASFGGTPLVVGTGTFVFPVSSRNFTQYYWYGHRGIDVALSEGSAVFASDTGTVTFAGWNIYGFGNLIVVNHGNGYETLYAHLSGINVRTGQIVNQGNVIGATGNTGNSSGPHIHFEIRLNGNQDDPCWFIGC
ncbi:MAG: peptidoglycan DD-metalloendopeptidase family protein [Chloroflexota bacterium]